MLTQQSKIKFKFTQEKKHKIQYYAKMEINDKNLRKSKKQAKAKQKPQCRSERGLDTRNAVGKYELLFQTKSDQLTSQNPASEDDWY